MRFCKNYHRLPDTPTKRGCDECRRENLASIRLKKAPPGEKPRALTSPRKARRYKTAFLDRRQVLAAYELYKAGYTVVQIAALGWERWGYKNERTARERLYRAFELEGLPMRPPTVRNLAQYRTRKAARLDERRAA